MRRRCRALLCTASYFLEGEFVSELGQRSVETAHRVNVLFSSVPVQCPVEMQACPHRTFEPRAETGTSGRLALLVLRAVQLWGRLEGVQLCGGLLIATSPLDKQCNILLDCASAASERTSQSSQFLEVEQRCYFVIVAIFLAQAVVAWPFVHGLIARRGPGVRRRYLVVIRHSLVRTFFKVSERSLIRPTRRLDRHFDKVCCKRVKLDK